MTKTEMRDRLNNSPYFSEFISDIFYLKCDKKITFTIYQGSYEDIFITGWTLEGQYSSFEEVLSFVPSHIQEYLLFNLDMFSSNRFERVKMFGA